MQPECLGASAQRARAPSHAARQLVQPHAGVPSLAEHRLVCFRVGTTGRRRREAEPALSRSDLPDGPIEPPRQDAGGNPAVGGRAKEPVFERGPRPRAVTGGNAEQIPPRHERVHRTVQLSGDIGEWLAVRVTAGQPLVVDVCPTARHVRTGRDRSPAASHDETVPDADAMEGFENAAVRCGVAAMRATLYAERAR
jgi:hypothetical protein